MYLQLDIFVSLYSKVNGTGVTEQIWLPYEK